MPVLANNTRRIIPVPVSSIKVIVLDIEAFKVYANGQQLQRITLISAAADLSPASVESA